MKDEIIQIDKRELRELYPDVYKEYGSFYVGGSLTITEIGAAHFLHLVFGFSKEDLENFGSISEVKRDLKKYFPKVYDAPGVWFSEGAVVEDIIRENYVIFSVTEYSGSDI